MDTWGPGPADATLDAGSVVTATTLGAAGASQAQENRSPYLGLRFCIAITGLFPSRN